MFSVKDTMMLKNYWDNFAEFGWPQCHYQLHGSQRRWCSRIRSRQRHHAFLGLEDWLQLPTMPSTCTTWITWFWSRSFCHDFRPIRNSVDHMRGRQNHQDLQRGWLSNRRVTSGQLEARHLETKAILVQMALLITLGSFGLRYNSLLQLFPIKMEFPSNTD